MVLPSNVSARRNTEGSVNSNRDRRASIISCVALAIEKGISPSPEICAWGIISKTNVREYGLANKLGNAKVLESVHTSSLIWSSANARIASAAISVWRSLRRNSGTGSLYEALLMCLLDNDTRPPESEIQHRLSAIVCILRLMLTSGGSVFWTAAFSKVCSQCLNTKYCRGNHSLEGRK